MAGFKFPLDAYVLAVPTIYGCLALTGLVVKTLTCDPEQSSGIQYYDDEAKAGKQGDYYNDSVKEMFRTRINSNRFGVFTNFFCSKQ